MSRIDIRFHAIAISCLLSIYTILTTHVLNDDAYGYLRAAELFNEEGVGAILDNYGWYGYSIIVAILDMVLPGGLLSAAHIFNTAMYALLIWAFITLSMEYKNTARIRIFSCILILSFVQINEMRPLLIRDCGFWAFCVLALLQQIRFHKDSRQIHAAGWCLSMLAATFFRLEGIILLLITPLAILISKHPLPTRVRNWAIMQGYLLAGTSVVLLVCVSAGVNLFSLFQYAYRYYLPGLLNLDGLMLGTANELNQVIFAPQNFPGNSGHGLVILAFAYLYTVSVNLLLALGLPQSILLGYGILKRDFQLPAQAAIPAFFFIAGSVIALLAFITIMHFLTQRYAVMASLILLSFLPMTLEGLYSRLKDIGKAHLFKVVFGLCLFYFSADTLTSFGPSKEYLRDSASWLANEISANATLYTNEYSIAYYSGHIDDYDKISQQARDYSGQFASGDILAVNIQRDDTQLRSAIENNENLIPIVSFENERGDRAEIFRYR